MKQIALFLSLAFALASCNRSETTTTPEQKETATTAPSVDTSHRAPSVPTALSGLALAGQKIFYNTSYGKIKDACSSCHIDGQPTTHDSRLRAGHTLVGIIHRTSTWNGTFKGEAVQKNAFGATMCAVMYQHKGDDMATVLSKSDIDALIAYFQAIDNAPGGISSNLKIQWVTKPAVHEEDKIDETAANASAKKIMMLPGDPDNGKQLFSRTCEYCHTMNEKKVGPPLAKAIDNPQMGAKSIRCGSAAMPFYGKDILTDQQIADIVAYLQQALGK